MMSVVPDRITEPDKTNFALAAYNIGYGNLGSTGGITRIFGGGATTGELIKYIDNTTKSNSFRAPIFYDSNNTAYYLDPAQRRYLTQYMATNDIGFRCVTDMLGMSNKKRMPFDILLIFLLEIQIILLNPYIQ